MPLDIVLILQIWEIYSLTYDIFDKLIMIIEYFLKLI